jgi:2-oxoisovalerate dehydrogenase E1 component
MSKKFSLKTTEKSILKKWFSLMALGRLIDDRAPNYLKQAIGWSYHAPYAGHDAIQLAIGQVFIKGEDHLFPYYRDMLTCISAGMTAEEIILNGISKDTDLASGGRHMSNHFAKPEWKIHNVSSCTGNHALHAAGVARAMKRYKHKGVAICSHGESATSEGYFYEAVNGASCEKLPVIFVLQDNGYGISVPKAEQTANEIAADNFSGFKNLKIIKCDGTDVISSINAMFAAREHAIEKQIPVIVQAQCVRIGSHSNSDAHELYRDEKELAAAKARDPYLKFRKELIQNKIFSEKDLENIEKEMKEEVLNAHSKAMEAPDPSPDSIYDYVIPDPYVSSKYPDGLHKESGEKIKYITGLNLALKESFRENPYTFMWGQDMTNKDKEGIFNVAKGMQKEFGKDRVFNAPIAEDFILGTANGFSRFSDDIRVVVEGAEFADYFWPAMEQFVECTHDYWRSKGQFSPNILIRLASGGYIGGGLYHSQNLEGTLSTFPGVRIIAPAFADDVYGLVKTAIKSKGLTVLLEPKALYNSKHSMEFIPEGFEVPFGKARIRRVGNNLTLITYGNCVHQSLEAAEKLSEEGYDIEVLDLRSLKPFDGEAILKSLEKTSRALVVHEDKIFGGFGGEIVSFINEKGFELLDAPVIRLGAADTPVGFNRILERAILPNSKKIHKAALKLLKY